MNKFHLFIITISITIVSCEFEGVESSNNESDLNIQPNASDTIPSEEVLEPELSNELLVDSIAGQPNDMVFQREDGLRVEWTEKNTNDPIALNDVVMINFKARVAAGEQYDSNEELGEPVPVKTGIGMVVKGWEEGLLKMHIGDKGRIMIPSALGYAENGYLTVIPPDADLIIDIEIIKRIEPIVSDEGVKVYVWRPNEKGRLPQKNQLITFDYFAYVMGENGHLYDNSYKNSQAFSFKLENDNVVDGLHQGMKHIKTGENAFIEIPSELAYGSKGLVDIVPPNTNVVYDVRVLSID